ncbi:MAG: ATP-grasp domain-containing protein [Deltaproteobacteria bacterium]|nr:ATP-grasp domain-containing protein [Deltaproteobacteria bacterium]
MKKVILLYNDYLEIYSRLEACPGELEEVFSAVEAIQESLENLDFDVVPVSSTKLNMELLALLKKNRHLPVFNLCESLEGDSEKEKILPEFMEKHGIVYTGSGPGAIETCLDKFAVKKVFQRHGIPTPGASLIKSAVRNGHFRNINFPLIIKPVHEDASIGIAPASVVQNERDALDRARYLIRELEQPAMAEEFIEGREISVAVWGNFPPTPVESSEIDFSELPPELPKIVTYNSKWNKESPEYCGTKPICPARIDEDLKARVFDIAVRAFAATGCRDYGRVDMRVSKAGQPYVVDVNPNPDLSPDAGFFRSVSSKGLDFTQMVGKIMGFAEERAERAVGARAPVTKPAVKKAVAVRN